MGTTTLTRQRLEEQRDVVESPREIARFRLTAEAHEALNVLRLMDSHEALRRQLADAERRVARLEAALWKLANECRGMTEAFEYDLRHVVGNANYAALVLRVEEADAALAASPSEPKEPS